MPAARFSQPNMVAIIAATALLIHGVQQASCASPPGTINVVVAGQSGLMADIGSLNPHAYRPNEFIAQNWVYEGLVAYGPGGKILPSLAESWTIEDADPTGGMTITFNLRRNVLFHDGAPWDAMAAKLNFDQIFVEPLKSSYHGWFDLSKRIQSWEVVDSHTFRVLFDSPYEAAMQDLALIRPVRFLSPNHLQADPARMKTCPPTTERFWETGVPQGAAHTGITCNGTRGVAGTGPWVFQRKITSQRVIDASTVWDTAASQLRPDERVQELQFSRFEGHWASAGGNIRNVVVKIMSSVEEVAPAVAQGRVDLVFGLDTINPTAFMDLHRGDDLDTFISEPLATRMVMFNTAQPPTNSLGVRKAIIHAVDKLGVIRKELAGIERPAYNLFSSNIPYADLDLSPALGLDREKALMILDALGWAPSAAGSVRQKEGQPLEVMFLFKNSSSTQAGIEDDIRRDLAAVGISVKQMGVSHDEWNLLANNKTTAWNLAFTETYGPPYDPWSYCVYWRTWGVFNHSQSGMTRAREVEGMFKLNAPMDMAKMHGEITRVMTMTDEAQRRQTWANILTAVHEQALFLPISFMVNVAVLNKRFENFVFGTQQFELPLSSIVDTEAMREGVQQGSRSSGSNKGAIAAIVVCGVAAVAAVAFAAILIMREKRGRPMFVPLINEEYGSADVKPSKV